MRLAVKLRELVHDRRKYSKQRVGDFFNELEVLLGKIAKTDYDHGLHWRDIFLGANLARNMSRCDGVLCGLQKFMPVEFVTMFSKAIARARNTLVFSYETQGNKCSSILILQPTLCGESQISVVDVPRHSGVQNVRRCPEEQLFD
jgi:hypothetical protein